MMSPQMVRLDKHLQRLRLNTVRERLEALLQEAAEKELSEAPQGYRTRLPAFGAYRLKDKLKSGVVKPTTAGARQCRADRCLTKSQPPPLIATMLRATDPLVPDALQRPPPLA